MSQVKNLSDRITAAAGLLASKGPNAALAAIQEALKSGSPASIQPNAAASSFRPDAFVNGLLSGLGAGVGASGGISSAKLSTGQPEFVSKLLEQLGVCVPGMNGGSTAPTVPATPNSAARTAYEDVAWRASPGTLAPAPASAPATTPTPTARATDNGQFLSKSFANQAGSRHYKLYIPGSYCGQPMPLMVMLHGCTQNPDDFSAGTQMNSVAEEKQCFVVYPAQEQSANASKCWNWFKAVDQQRGQGEPSIIAGITNTVIAEYGLDRDKVYVAGLSAGGAMAIIMGTTYPDLYKAVGVHSGLPYAAANDLPSAMNAMRGVAARRARFSGGNSGNGSSSSQTALGAIPIIVFHGDRDTTVSAANGDRLIDDFVHNFAQKDASAPINVLVENGGKPGQRTYTRTSHHADGQPPLAEHWVIHGAGHAWAGGSANGSYTDASGPDASREMLRFFYTQSAGSAKD
jgi:poly(hydroxyalkanoate) depolymerase family esterase